ncbi:NAD(P)H-hydrate dehydratase [Acidisarcina polymorpha]|nr:NAD(P)H-hydrate dehydratase [Acidisarcina polymorpha]
MKILTAKEMREVDVRTVEQYGVAATTLMENAGAAVARFVLREFPDYARITILCGRGNNGGDGFVAARALAEAGRVVAVLLLGEAADLKGDAKVMFERLPQRALFAKDEAALDEPSVRALFSNTELFLDAVVGTGFQPPLRGVVAALAERIHGLEAPVVAVDLPSGWDADSRGADSPGAFRADAVVTFTAPKPAHLFGNMTRGGIVVAGIGSPEEAIISTTGLTWSGAAAEVSHKPRVPDSNKGMFGHVLVVGGAKGTAGAAAMASVSALRAGAGLVTAAVPESILPTVARAALELMTVPLVQGKHGEIARVNADPERLKFLIEKITVLAVGPGISQHPETAEFVIELVRQSRLPLVLDADALNIVSKNPELLDGSQRPVIITPHPGEMARLIGGSVKDVQADRENTARNFATRHQVTVVLKGWRTLIAHPNGAVAVNTTGNPGMAKGGSGDILTGIVAAMVAQYARDPAAENVAAAVTAAVYLHGLAADLAVLEQDEHTLLATDTVSHLCNAFRYRSKDKGGYVWLQGFPNAEDRRYDSGDNQQRRPGV